MVKDYYKLTEQPAICTTAHATRGFGVAFRLCSNRGPGCMSIMAKPEMAKTTLRFLTFVKT